jgi:23S rRNA pseudouridine1911/1915/1917 synthase
MEDRNRQAAAAPTTKTDQTDQTDQTELVVAPGEDGQRLDRYVAEQIETRSRSYVQHLIQAGALLVNQHQSTASYRVRSGDTVTIRWPEPQPVDLVPEALPLTIIYEDTDVVVVDKAASMVVHPAPGHPTGTLVHALLSRYPDMRISDDLRPGIVHRLDQGTSGLLVVARNDRAMHLLSEQQKARAMHKAYLAVVEHHFKEPEGVIDAPIGRHPTDRKRQAVVASGREARTRYRVLEELEGYTLVEAILETGRTHQIRVHFSSKNRPVLGDRLYGPRKPRTIAGLERQFLHAYQLGFSLPRDGSWCEFTSPLPDDLARVLEKLRSRAQRLPPGMLQ